MNLKACHALKILKPMKMGIFGLLLWCAAVLPVAAHLSPIPMATATIQPDGRFTFNLTFDVMAFALDSFPENVTDLAMNELLDGPVAELGARLGDAQIRFQKEFSVFANGTTGAVATLIFPSVADVQRYKESAPLIRLPVMLLVAVEGRMPAGSRSVSFRLPAKLGSVALTVVRPDQPIGVLIVNSGEATSPLPLKLEEVAATSPATQAIPEPSRWEWARRFLELGFLHILPRGTDHILFVLGLFLLGNSLRPLLIQVTAFTVAHSFTLALSLYGVFRLPPAVVEPLIAFSVAFVALENMFTAKLHRWRLFVVFGFGLIHGLGFAGVLTELGLPRREFATALVTFNAGVELGQLSVIGLAFLAIGWWRGCSWYRRGIVLPASGLIAAIAIYWTIQRVALYSRST